MRPSANHYVIDYHDEENATDPAKTTAAAMATPNPCIHLPLYDAGETTTTTTEATESIPDSVLQYERQLRKVRAASMADRPISLDALRLIYVDDDIVVTDKPSGILCVPGVAGPRNSSLLELVYQQYGHRGEDDEEYDEKRPPQQEASSQKEPPARLPLVGEGDHDKEPPPPTTTTTISESNNNNDWKRMNGMIVHRLDMDTSGLVVFGRTPEAVRKLHQSFRDRQVQKVYHALVCGHVPLDQGRIDLPLQRDHCHPPFWRVATPSSERAAAQALHDLQHAGWKKLVAKKPKPSQTQFQVLQREYRTVQQKKLPVTRLQLIPLTGRTHQLRIHCAAVGHAIVADPAYGWGGEAHMNGGYTEEDMNLMPFCKSRASLALQQSLAAQPPHHDEPPTTNLCLHATFLAFAHPTQQKWMEFQTPTPF